MLIFNLTIHHLWGRVLAKFQEARAVAYADDGYIKAKLSVALQVLAELKSVFKADAGLELNVSLRPLSSPRASRSRLRLISAQHPDYQPRIDAPYGGCCPCLILS
jgi:hypothetical protein